MEQDAKVRANRSIEENFTRQALDDLKIVLG